MTDVNEHQPLFDVAAYGTLRRGQALDHVWQGFASTIRGRVRGWNLYQPDGCPYPVAFPNGNELTTIVVDVVVPYMDCGIDLLNRFDMIEHFPHLYSRVIVDVELETGFYTSAWIYTPAQPLEKWLPAKQVVDGDWRKRGMDLFHVF